MANFTAQKRLHKWNFEAMGGGKGEFLEPSEEGLIEFQARMSEILREATGDKTIDLSNVDALNSAMAQVSSDRDTMKLVHEQQVDALAAVLSDVPSGSEPTREDVAKLNSVVSRQFVQWLWSDVLSPESVRPATRS